VKHVADAAGAIGDAVVNAMVAWAASPLELAAAAP
jgi:hypothetical protein